MNTRDMTTEALRSLMDECRKEYARRARKAISDGTLPVPELIKDSDGNVRLFKSIHAYHEAHPQLDMLTCTEAVKAEAGL